jgi:hypothetical protein
MSTAMPLPPQQTIPVPKRCANLPTARGFIVPWFVQWLDGKPEFRMLDRSKWYFAIREQACWICGQSLKGSINAPFVIGPMCTVNRISAEPPCHVECARYAARACPFLSRPNMVRRELEPELAAKVTISEAHVPHNPAVTALYFAREYRVKVEEDNVPLIHLGTPSGVEWFAKGERATRNQVEEAFEKGLKTLREAAQEEGQEAEDDLDRRIVRARAYWPKR